MTLLCIDHNTPVVTDGDGFWCPEGHEVHSVNMDDILNECLRTLVTNDAS